jgi:hypothetical protein
MRYTKLAFAAATALGLAATGLQAQDQEGLVNVSVDDNTVQVPISVAANVCGVEVNALADLVGSDETACEIDQQTAAENGIGTGEEDGAEGNSPGNGNGQQNGLVNVSLDGNTVQVPIGIAANVCGVEANVIAQNKGSDEAVCDIESGTEAASQVEKFANR